jgi:hypothetical protein
LIGEELAQSGPDDGVVIDDGNSDHGFLTRSALADTAFCIEDRHE